MVLPPDQLLHLGPDPAGASWNHFDLGLGLSSHINYPQSQLKNSPPQGAPWWYSKTNPTSGKDVVVFSAPLGGATTSTNTQYARCELREYERNGTTKMAFDPKDGDHWIEGKYRVFGLAGLDKPEVTMLQAHDGDDDVIMISTYQGGLRLRYNGSQVAVLDSSVSDGDEFYLKIRVNNGTPSVYYSSNADVPSTTPVTTSPSSSGFFSSAASGWYFKTGSYNQTNENTDPDVDPDASIIRIEIRELKHWHSKTPLGGAWPTPAPYTATGTPSVDAGTDSTFALGSSFSRTASVTLNGATLSSQSWSILSGPAGVGTTLSTTASVSWTPSTSGIYTLGFSADTSAGNFSDQVTVTVTTVSIPVDTTTAAGVKGWGKPIKFDEFNYTGAPNSTEWGVYDGPGHSGNGTRDPNRVTVDGTKMVGTGLANGASFGMSHRFDQQYGKWELRLRTFNEGSIGGVPVGSTTIFQDGFETGNFGKWSEIEGLNGTENTSGYNQNSNHQLKIVNLGASRPHVARFELRGDDESNVGGERIEILGPGSTDVSEGDERWIEFDVMHDSTWPTPSGDFVDIMQFHQPSGVGDSPPLSFNVTRQNILQTDGSGVSHTPRPIYTVQPGVWRHCVYHIKFSSSSSVGFVKCWVDGVKTVDDQRATMYQNADNYWKLGIYRDSDDDSTMVLYYDNIRMSSGPATGGGGSTSGNTYHPVVIIWPESGLWPEDGEYDFVELSSPGQQTLEAFMHFPHDADVSVQQRYFSKSGVDTSQWHNYAIEWTPNELVGYVDGVEWFRTSGGANDVRRNIQDMPSGHLTIQLDNYDGTDQVPGRMEVDWVRVYPLIPIPLDPGGGGGEPGGGTSTGVYPSFVAASTPVKANDGSGGTISVPAPAGMQPGYFQICAIECATSAELITSVPVNWNLLDEQAITTTAGGDSGDTSRVLVYYNTTGDNVSRSWTKSGTRGFHAVRMAWKDVSALGQHFVRTSSSTLTPYATPVTPGTDRAIAVAILGSDRLNTTAGPVTVPTGWTQRYNQEQIVNGDEYEWISVADIQVPDRAVAGANVPTSSGLATSNFKLTNADACQVFSFVLEGPISTGTVYNGGVLLPAQPKINVNLFLSPVPVGGLLLRIFPELIARSILRGGVNLYALANLILNASLFPRGALIIIPNLTFSTSQVTFAGLLLQAVIRLQAGALPYRKPVLRNEYEYPPEDHPFRLIAQRILDGEIVEWELPVDEDFEYTVQLSGPTVMQGSFSPERIAVQELGLDGYAFWLHVEIGQEIRASAILLPPQYEGPTMSFSAEGVAAVPHYTTYDSVYSQLQVDPLSVVRTLWNYVQAQPQSDYGVVLSQNSSPVRLGKLATTETIANSDGTTTTREIPAEPYELNWWDAKNVGEEIDTLSGQTPFDYIERHKWNSTRTDVEHFVDLGYPRLGVARNNLLFNEENILEVVPVQEPEDTYASAVLVIGAGDGADTIRAFRSEPFADRVRKQVVVTDKSITSQQAANSRAEQELALRRGRMFEVGELTIAAYHTNAPIGSYQVGDDIQVQVEVPWLMLMHTAWYRITSIQNRPSSDRVRLGLARSDTLLDTSDVWIQPDDYVPFQPPPPVGAIGWQGNVFMLAEATLVVVPGVPVPTARAIMVAVPVLVADGIVYGGSFAFANNLIVLHSLSINGPQSTLVAEVAMVSSTIFSADGLATPQGFATVSMISPTTLDIGILEQQITTLALAIEASLTANASVATNVGVSTDLTASAALSVGAGLTAQGAVSLVVGKTLSANGTVSSGTTVTQLGKTSNGVNSSSSSANKTVVSKATASVNGTVTAGHARLWVDTGSASSVRMVVYADSGGLPGSQLGSSDPITVSTTTVDTLHDFTFTGAQQASIANGTDYWIGFTWPDPGTNNISWSRDGTAGQAQQNSLNNAASFGTPGTTLSGPIDAYVDVTSSTGGGGGTTPVIRSSASAAQGNVTTVACPKPAGLTVGDYIIAFQESDRDGSLSAMTAPSGFTLLGSASSPNGGSDGAPYGKVWGKVATSTDVAASTFSFPDDTGANSTVVMVAVQEGTYSSTTPISSLTWTIVGTFDYDISAPSITGSTGALLLTTHMAETGGAVASFSSGPSDMTLVAQSVAGNSTYTRMAVYKKEILVSGATGVKTAILSGEARGYLGVTLQVNDAS